MAINFDFIGDGAQSRGGALVPLLLTAVAGAALWEFVLRPKQQPRPLEGHAWPYTTSRIEDPPLDYYLRFYR